MQQTANSPAAMTVKEMAAVLRIGVNKAYELCHSDGFPAVWLSPRRCVIPCDLFHRWLNEEAGTSSPAGKRRMASTSSARSPRQRCQSPAHRLER